MASSPRFKVYSDEGEYRASVKYVEDAAALIALLGPGSTIRDGHSRVVWHEGVEDEQAGESYDHVREVVWQRCGIVRG